MSLESSMQIDYISLHEEYVRCTVVDSMDWSNEGKHLLLLQEKINNYLMFIESDQIYVSYPKAVGKKIMISLYSLYPYTEKAKQFLSMVQKKLNESGYALTYQVGSMDAGGTVIPAAKVDLAKPYSEKADSDKNARMK